MTSALHNLSAPVLRGLARALGSGRVPLPCQPMDLHDFVPEGDADAVGADLNALVASVNAAVMLTRLLEMVAAEREDAERAADAVDLVWSGPEAPDSLNRDTGVVVRELFLEAERSVLIASYALDAGEKARAIFAPLADRLDRGDHLDVQLFVNIARPHGDHRTAAEIVANWASRFRAAVWPGKVLPAVFYDPRALVTDGRTRASMHAKCVVIDERVALVTSANFTEAAHARNVEVGALLHDEEFARTLATQFMAQVRHRELVALPM